MDNILRRYFYLLLFAVSGPVFLHGQQAADTVYNNGHFYVHSIGEACARSGFVNGPMGEYMNNGTVWFQGSFENDGIFGYLPGPAVNLGLTLFESGGVQPISGGGDTRFYNVMFNNSSDGGFSLSQDISVSNTAHFSDGIVAAVQPAPGSYVNVFYMESGSSWEGASDSCHVDGFVCKAGGGAFTFPIGDGGHYRHAAISAPSSEADSFAARYVAQNSDAACPHSSKGAGILQLSATEYWVVERVAGASDVEVTLSWDTEKGSDASLDYGNIAVVRWDGSQWQNEGRTASSVDGTSGEVSAAVGGYGIFTLATVEAGENHAPLAVDDSAVVEINSVSNTGNVMSNDSDPDGDAISVTGFTVGGTTYSAGETAIITGYGEITINAGGTWYFTPETGFSGTVPGITYTISDGGLSDSAVLSIEVVEEGPQELSIPNIFSPNGDGIQDYFRARGLDSYPGARIRIFSRWGALVYKKDGYGDESRWGNTGAWWDGSSNQGLTFGGDKLPAATYFYILELGNGENRSGYVYLNR